MRGWVHGCLLCWMSLGLTRTIREAAQTARPKIWLLFLVWRVPLDKTLELSCYCATQCPTFSSDPLQQPVHQKPVSLAHRGQELRFNSEVNQEEGGFGVLSSCTCYLLLSQPSLQMTNGKWEQEGSKWLLAHRVSYLFLSHPDSQVYAIPAHSGKTKYIEFGSGC